MENAVDALKMAAAVLIFVLAISIAILSFGQAREAADTILDYRDRETLFINGNYYYKATGTERKVGLETVFPAIIRAYLENYKVVFEGLDKPIYKVILNDGTRLDRYTLDLESNSNNNYKNVILANDEAKSEFLCGILYGKFKNTQAEFEKKFNISLDGCENLYTQLTVKQQNFKILEYLGVYYQSDTAEQPDSNKTEKRIITYKITPK